MTERQLMYGHDPNAVDCSVAADYLGHSHFVAEGREANGPIGSSIFTALPGIGRRTAAVVSDAELDACPGGPPSLPAVRRGARDGDMLAAPSADDVRPRTVSAEHRNQERSPFRHNEVRSGGRRRSRGWKSPTWESRRSFYRIEPS
jgi:hypothetical protein